MASRERAPDTFPRFVDGFVGETDNYYVRQVIRQVTFDIDYRTAGAVGDNTLDGSTHMPQNLSRCPPRVIFRQSKTPCLLKDKAF